MHVNTSLKNTKDKSDRKYDSYLGSILRPDNAAGCSGHSSREEVAGDGDKRGEPERREEG